MNKKTKEIYKCSIKIREKSTSSSRACTVTNFCKLEKSEKTNDLFFFVENNIEGSFDNWEMTKKNL